MYGSGMEIENFGVLKNEKNNTFFGIASTGSGGLSVHLATSGGSPYHPFYTSQFMGVALRAIGFALKLDCCEPINKFFAFFVVDT